jgi:hypothetical protein
MRRLAWAAGTLCAILIVVLLGVRVAASAGRGGLALLFTAPDGTSCERPCLFGVRPGVTRFDDALLILSQHPLLKGFRVLDNPARNGVQFVGADLCIGFARDEAGRVAGIDVQVERPRSACLGAPRALGTLGLSPLTSAALGDVITTLGQPDAFQLGVNGLGAITRMYYRDDHLEILNVRPVLFRVRRHDPLVMMYMNAGSRSSTAPVAGRWIGFTTLRRYLAGLRVPHP